jgi:hypothetical protein
MNGLDEGNENRDGQIFLFTLFSLLKEILHHPHFCLVSTRAVCNASSIRMDADRTHGRCGQSQALRLGIRICFFALRDIPS